jgi:DNA-binding transcriptional LysR family regulator
VDLRQLENFVAVAETGSFTRAAARLHVVQSGVSATVKGLETELGLVLFRRSSRAVALSDEGRALLPAARAALAAVDEVRDVAAGFHGSIRGTVSMGLLMAPDIFGFPELVGRFHQDYPEVRIELRSSPTGTEGLIAGILDESIDLAVVVLDEDSRPGLELSTITGGEMVLAVRDDDPLAALPEVRMADISGRDFVDGPVGWGNRASVDRLFARARQPRRVTVEVGDPAVQLSYVQAGLGIAFVVPNMVPPGRGLTAIELVDARPRWLAALAVKSDRRVGAAVTRLADLIREHGEERRGRLDQRW